MKKAVLPIFLFSLLILLTSAIRSFKNTTLVLPPNDFELNLPDIPYDYQVEFPQHVEDFVLGWGNDVSFVSTITNEKATLGRVLFYDDRLSGDNSLSCGSCHKQEFSFSDNSPLSDGIEDNLTTRNSMQLNDLGWQVTQDFFWDYRSNSIEDAVVQPILAAHELGKNMPDLIAKLEAADEYSSLFESAYGTQEITENRIANALAQFISSMSPFHTRFDLGAANNFADFTPSELSGKLLFEENCTFCHVSPHFGTTGPFGFFPGGNNGLDSVFTDPGMGEWMGDPLFEGFFKSPSLRNVEVSGPYMHDGRFETLHEVINFYSEGVQPNENSFFNWIFGESFTGYQFEETQKEDLINFLLTLTDEALLTDEKWSNPWSNPTSIELVENPLVKVFPNPVADMVQVQFNNQTGENFDIAIFDISGKLVKSITTSASRLEIPREDTPAGIYEMTISGDDFHKSYKLVYR